MVSAPPGTALPVTLADPGLESDVLATLAEVEAMLYASLASTDPLVGEAARHLVDAGGKRFRPLLVLLAAEVIAPGMDTVGVFSPGSDSHIRTTTRRYGKASTMLLITPITTSQVCPPPMAAANTANLLVKPLVNGMPAKASMRKANAAATTG